MRSGFSVAGIAADLNGPNRTNVVLNSTAIAWLAIAMVSGPDSGQRLSKPSSPVNVAIAC